MASCEIINDPRGYQVNLLEKAMKQNSIVYLPTGMGKTFISVMLIKHFSQSIGDSTIIFLAPTVALVEQQAQYIRRQTKGLNLKIDHHAGEGDVGWENREWKDSLKNNDVTVLTPMLFYNILVTGFLQMSDISLLIFDECHHCTKKHPYSLIFTDFYYDLPILERPHIFGMTATPIISSIKLQKFIQLGSCEICSVQYHSQNQKDQHIRGIKHQKRVIKAGLLGIKESKQTDKLIEIAVSKTTGQQIERSLYELEKRMDSIILFPDDPEYFNWRYLPSEKNISFNLIPELDIEIIHKAIKKTFNTASFQSVPLSTNISCEQIPISIDGNRLWNLVCELGCVALLLYLDLTLNDILNSPSTIGDGVAYNLLKKLRNFVFSYIKANAGHEDTYNTLFSPKIQLLFNIIDDFFNKYSNTKQNGRLLIFAQERKVVALLGKIVRGNVKIGNEIEAYYIHQLSKQEPRAGK